MLYHVEKNQTPWMIPQKCLQEKLFHAAHDRMFGAHLTDAKIHSVLSKHYWWPGMHTDIIRWCRACLTCAAQRTGKAVKPPAPIPVSGPFDQVIVDILKFPKSLSGNAKIFVDYLTNWPELCAVPDQTALTIANLLVDHVISRHGIPVQLLLGRGAAFLSILMQEVCQLLGVNRVNPQTDRTSRKI